LEHAQQIAAQSLRATKLYDRHLYEGVFYSREPQHSEEGLQAFLRGVEILGPDDETIRMFGRERGRLGGQG
jgi:hypothetical protein